MNIGMIGIAACLGLSALGSALGAGIAGMTAIGSWKKCFLQNKPVPFLLVAFAGAPLTQTIYGFILMNQIKGSSLDEIAKMAVGLFAGLAMGASALYQGKAAAYAADALAETGQGFGNYILVVGLIETVALFVMVFSMGLVG
ncbi:MAG: V-type ATP synthase subunit K [Treponemataceae bacterium]|uniref:V-type ATP synthase subunit K n=1 Tax=Treponema sp. J25 TaxID=2094121 RepID=UPI001045786D|nr:V-type ATP synthase subunit K [Treponema sp. J25]MCX7948923.1 V-type ATP synthase subunit K [Treponemataceae bacterium]HOJ99030.1 V-type ATP synthase subunit K [Termitinemataceae bacterium]TCW60275.1 V-type ATP synthase subunit K [Treponema sp. J25]HOM22912.1 V-type ATP synthase subunit K [Termitinemataceae bacterium]HPQ00253.1 V-type ATP synthase subunit K [Termitinemataceae bacterium]